MKKRVLLSMVFISGMTQFLKAQLVYKDVAAIFYARCTSCHHTNASDFPFMNYAQTAFKSSDIQFQLSINRMPPWSADTNYTRFQHERLITSIEKQKILTWISDGSLPGDTTLAPPAPVYPNYYELAETADLTLSIGHFTSTSSTTDKYFCFSIPSGLTQDRIIRAFEVVPGNKKIVHHAVITADTTGTYASDLSGGCYNIPGNLNIGTYAPGTKPTVFPSHAPLKAGLYLKAGSKVIIQLHYPAGSAGQVDSTKLRLFFYPVGTTGVRRLYSETPLQNWNMIIPANSVVPYTAYYPSSTVGIPTPISVFGVMPHSHLLCQSILYYAVNPGIDTIPLVHINKWDFEWQDYYVFKKLVKIPAGYKLFSKHIYDNTTANPNNPNTPPITVFSNTGTKDEMLFDGMMYLPYQAGDELLDLAGLMDTQNLVGIPETKGVENALQVNTFPNPFQGSVTLRYTQTQAAVTTIVLRDLLGKQIFVHKSEMQSAGAQDWTWDGRDAHGDKVAAGVYFYSLQSGNQRTDGKLIKAER